MNDRSLYQNISIRGVQEDDLKTGEVEGEYQAQNNNIRTKEKDDKTMSEVPKKKNLRANNGEQNDNNLLATFAGDRNRSSKIDYRGSKWLKKNAKNSGKEKMREPFRHGQARRAGNKKEMNSNDGETNSNDGEKILGGKFPPTTEVDDNVIFVPQNNSDVQPPVRVEMNRTGINNQNNGDPDDGNGENQNNTVESFELHLEPSSIANSTEEAERLVVILTILITAAQQISLLNSSDDFGLFSATYGWLAVFTLGFDFSEEDADFAFTIAALLLPWLLWVLYCYVKQRKGHSSKNLAESKWERTWFYLSIFVLFCFALAGAFLAAFAKPTGDGNKKLFVIAMTVISFCGTLILVPFWYGRLILYYDVLQAESKITYEVLEVGTIQLFFNTLLVPMFALAVRYTEGRNVLESDDKNYLPLAGILMFCLMICGTSSFIVAGSPTVQRQAELPDVPVQACCCYQTKRSPGLVQYINNYIFCFLCCTCDANALDSACCCMVGTRLKCNDFKRINRDPTYPWAFDKVRAWWFPFFIYLEQIIYAAYREFYLFREEEEVMDTLDDLSNETDMMVSEEREKFLLFMFITSFLMPFLLVCFRPYGGAQGTFLLIADFSQRTVFLIIVSILFTAAKQDEDNQEKYYLLATIITSFFIGCFFITGGVLRLLFDLIVVYYYHGDVSRNEEISKNNNSTQQVDALFNEDNQYVDYRIWRYLTQNQRLYLLAKLIPQDQYKAELKKQCELQCKFPCFNKIPYFNKFTCFNKCCKNCYLYKSDNAFKGCCYLNQTLLCLMGDNTLTTFDLEYIDFAGNGHSKARYLLHRGLTGHASYGKLKRIEFNGASFTAETWNAVREVADKLHAECIPKNQKGFRVEEIMLTNCSFEQNAFQEFVDFLKAQACKDYLKALVLIHCKIPEIHEKNALSSEALFEDFITIIVGLKHLEVLFLAGSKH